MPTTVSVHRVLKLQASFAKSGTSAWVTVTAIDEQDAELVEVTFFTNGNLDLAKAIAEAINSTVETAPEEEEIAF